MAPEKSSKTKTQTLSLRLDPKTRFILEFISRIRGQSITTVVERAIKEVAGKVVLSEQSAEFGNGIEEVSWNYFWDPDEGVRNLKLLANDQYPTTYEEDELRSFTLAHHEFFYTNEYGQMPLRDSTSVLWPKIDMYVSLWRETKATDYFGCGSVMAKDLETAGLKPPKWPRHSKKADDFAQELDDEIPF